MLHYRTAQAEQAETEVAVVAHGGLFHAMLNDCPLVQVCGHANNVANTVCSFLQQPCIRWVGAGWNRLKPKKACIDCQHRQSTCSHKWRLSLVKSRNRSRISYSKFWTCHSNALTIPRKCILRTCLLQGRRGYRAPIRKLRGQNLRARAYVRVDLMSSPSSWDAIAVIHNCLLERSFTQILTQNYFFSTQTASLPTRFTPHHHSPLRMCA